MLRFLLFLLVFVLLTARTLGYDLSIAPGLSFKNLFIYIIFFSLAIQAALTRQRKLEILTVLVPMSAYTLYAVFTWLVALLVLQYPGYGALESAMLLKSNVVDHLLVLLIFFYGVTNAPDAIWLLRRIVWLVVIGNFVTVIDALNFPDLGLITERADGRVSGIFLGSNEYGAFVAFFLPQIFALAVTSKGLMRAIAGAGVLVSGLAFLMALSRGAIVGLVAGGFLGAFYLRNFIPLEKILRAGLMTVALSMIVLAAGFAAGYGELFLDRLGLVEGDSFEMTSGRTEIWENALADMLEHPISFITGFGWAAYEEASGQHFATHNTYLYILYNLGALGVMLFLLVVTAVLRIARASLARVGQASRHMLVAFIIGFVALLVSLFFGEIYTAWLFIWAFAGVSLRLAVSDGGPDLSALRRAPEP